MLPIRSGGNEPIGEDDLPVGGGDRCIGAAVVRIESRRLLKQLYRLDRLRLGVAVKIVQALQDRIERLRVVGLDLRGRRPLCAGQLDRKSRNDVADHPILKRKDASERAVVAVGPKVLTGSRIDQLRVNPHPIALALHAALKHVTHAEVLGDLPNVGRAVLVGQDRVPRDDKDTGNLREVGDQVFGDAIGEILLRRIGAEIVEGQYRDGRWAIDGLIDRAGASEEPPGNCGAGDEQQHRDGDGHAGDRHAGARGGCSGSRSLGQKEPVTAPGDRLQGDMPVVTQCAADFMDALHKAVIGDRDARPNRLHQLVLGDELIGVLVQIPKH